MTTIKQTAALACAMALMSTPAWATGRPTDTPNSSSNPGTAHQPANATSNPGAAHQPPTPGPKAGLPAKAKAYGRYCKGQSKKRSDAAAGTSGSPFSQCVTAMAKLAAGQTASPRAACKLLSKHRLDAAAGTKGTPFSQCVRGAAKLLHDQSDAPSGTSDTATSDSGDQTS
jgi:hypothetical protein